MSTKSFFGFIIFVNILWGCAKKEDVTPISADQIAGTWQMTTSKILLKANVNGKVETAYQTRAGKNDELLQIKSDGTIADAKDLFGTGSYSWKYSISGNELKLYKNTTNFAYFTLKVSGNTMTWVMNTEQTNRALNEGKGFNSVLNVDVEDVRGLILQNDFTIEFVKK